MQEKNDKGRPSDTRRVHLARQEGGMYLLAIVWASYECSTAGCMRSTDRGAGREAWRLRRRMQIGRLEKCILQNTTLAEDDTHLVEATESPAFITKICILFLKFIRNNPTTEQYLELDRPLLVLSLMGHLQSPRSLVHAWVTLRD